mgnify:CR=1 FL=1
MINSSQFLKDSEASLGSAWPEPSPVVKKTAECRASGVVQAVDNGIITLSHQPIPELNWGAMTMDFTLTDPAPQVKVGDKVMFSFTLDDEAGAVITHLMPQQEAKK